VVDPRRTFILTSKDGRDDLFACLNTIMEDIALRASKYDLILL
jgi:hypothetical protein